MIESVNLIDIYRKNKEEIILNIARKKTLEIRQKKSLENKMIEIIETATNELNELYLSQLSKEQKKDLANGKYVEQQGFSLIMQEPIRLITDGSLIVNSNFEDDKIKKIKDDTEKELLNLEKIIRTIKAHVAIAKTKDEVEEILKRYNILDNEGKLVNE